MFLLTKNNPQHLFLELLRLKSGAKSANLAGCRGGGGGHGAVGRRRRAGPGAAAVRLVPDQTAGTRLQVGLAAEAPVVLVAARRRQVLPAAGAVGVRRRRRLRRRRRVPRLLPTGRVSQRAAGGRRLAGGQRSGARIYFGNRMDVDGVRPSAYFLLLDLLLKSAKSIRQLANSKTVR